MNIAEDVEGRIYAENPVKTKYKLAFKNVKESSLKIITEHVWNLYHAA